MKIETILEKGSSRLNEDNLVVQGNTLEWVQTGDAQIILIYHDTTHEVLVDREDHDYETLCLWQVIGKSDSPGTDKRLVDQIKKRAGIEID